MSDNSYHFQNPENKSRGFDSFQPPSYDGKKEKPCHLKRNISNEAYKAFKGPFFQKRSSPLKGIHAGKLRVDEIAFDECEEPKENKKQNAAIKTTHVAKERFPRSNSQASILRGSRNHEIISPEPSERKSTGQFIHELMLAHRQYVQDPATAKLIQQVYIELAEKDRIVLDSLSYRTEMLSESENKVIENFLKKLSDRSDSPKSEETSYFSLLTSSVFWPENTNSINLEGVKEFIEVQKTRVLIAGNSLRKDSISSANLSQDSTTSQEWTNSSNETFENEFSYFNEKYSSIQPQESFEEFQDKHRRLEEALCEYQGELASYGTSSSDLTTSQDRGSPESLSSISFDESKSQCEDKEKLKALIEQVSNELHELDRKVSVSLFQLIDKSVQYLKQELPPARSEALLESFLQRLAEIEFDNGNLDVKVALDSFTSLLPSPIEKGRQSQVWNYAFTFLTQAADRLGIRVQNFSQLGAFINGLKEDLVLQGKALLADGYVTIDRKAHSLMKIESAQLEALVNDHINFCLCRPSGVPYPLKALSNLLSEDPFLGGNKLQLVCGWKDKIVREIKPSQEAEKTFSALIESFEKTFTSSTDPSLEQILMMLANKEDLAGVTYLHQFIDWRNNFISALKEHNVQIAPNRIADLMDSLLDFNLSKWIDIDESFTRIKENFEQDLQKAGLRELKLVIDTLSTVTNLDQLHQYLICHQPDAALTQYIRTYLDSLSIHDAYETLSDLQQISDRLLIQNDRYPRASLSKLPTLEDLDALYTNPLFNSYQDQRVEDRNWYQYSMLFYPEKFLNLVPYMSKDGWSMCLPSNLSKEFLRASFSKKEEVIATISEAIKAFSLEPLIDDSLFIALMRDSLENYSKGSAQAVKLGHRAFAQIILSEEEPNTADSNHYDQFYKPAIQKAISDFQNYRQNEETEAYEEKREILNLGYAFQDRLDLMVYLDQEKLGLTEQKKELYDLVQAILRPLQNQDIFPDAALLELLRPSVLNEALIDKLIEQIEIGSLTSLDPYEDKKAYLKELIGSALNPQLVINKQFERDFSRYTKPEDPEQQFYHNFLIAIGRIERAYIEGAISQEDISNYFSHSSPLSPSSEKASKFLSILRADESHNRPYAIFDELRASSKVLPRSFKNEDEFLSFLSSADAFSHTINPYLLGRQKLNAFYELRSQIKGLDRMFCDPKRSVFLTKGEKEEIESCETSFSLKKCIEDKIKKAKKDILNIREDYKTFYSHMKKEFTDDPFRAYNATKVLINAQFLNERKQKHSSLEQQKPVFEQLKDIWVFCLNIAEYTPLDPANDERFIQGFLKIFGVSERPDWIFIPEEIVPPTHQYENSKILFIDINNLYFSLRNLADLIDEPLESIDSDLCVGLDLKSKETKFPLIREILLELVTISGNSEKLQALSEKVSALSYEQKAILKKVPSLLPAEAADSLSDVGKQFGEDLNDLLAMSDVEGPDDTSEPVDD